MNPWIDSLFAATLYGTNIPLGALLSATAAIIGLFFVSLYLNNWLITFFKRFVARIPGEDKTRLSDRITGFAPSLYLLMIVLIVVSIVAQNPVLGWLTDNVWYRFLAFIALISVVFSLSRVTPVFISIYLHNRDRIDGKSTQPVDPTIRSLFVIILNIILFVFALFQSFEVLGVRPTSLVAGASVTAIILGFALQNVLADIFSSFSLYLDQPFRVGDTIKVGNETGKVLSIGFKTTRLKTLHGEELTISNSELTKVQIKNLERLKKRRVEIMVELSKKVDFTKVSQFPTLSQQCIAPYKELQYELCNLMQINEKSYQYMLAYNVLVPSYKRHHELKELLLTDLITTCQKNGVEIVSAV